MISIIVASYNSAGVIETCIDSILTQDFKNYEIIIIDNNSTDNTKSILRRYPRITLIENSANYGFSKAYNQGIEKSKGRFILCLNHDIKLTQGFLSAIRTAIDTNDKIGAVQPKVLNKDGNKIDTTGIHLTFLRRFYDIGAGKPDEDRFNRPRYIFGACAAAVLYRKKALDSIKQGGEYFDEDFFCLAEDVDLSWRMRKEGWLALYHPKAVCLHNRGISGDKNKYHQYLIFRNRYLMLIKNESLTGKIKLLIVFFIYDLWKNLYMLCTNRTYTLKAYKEIVRLFPKMAKKRGF